MIKGKLADIIVSFYILGTLFLRFTLEDSLQNHPIISVSLGAIMLILIWSVIKLKWLQPDYFGLLNKKTQNDESIKKDGDISLFI